MSAYEQPNRCVGCAWSEEVEGARCLLHAPISDEERESVKGWAVAMVFETPRTVEERSVAS